MSLRPPICFFSPTSSISPYVSTNFLAVVLSLIMPRGIISTSGQASFSLANLVCAFAVGSLHPYSALIPFSVTEGRTAKATFLFFVISLSVIPSATHSAISKRSPSHTITAVRLLPSRALATMPVCVGVYFSCKEYHFVSNSLFNWV